MKIIQKLFFSYIILLDIFICTTGLSQNIPVKNDLISGDWPENCKKAEIISSLDRKVQPAIFLSAYGEDRRPLIVSLHTWSYNYEQKDTLVWQCMDKNYNYIHPDFRGKNNNPEACGSPEAIQDIDDAITYAINNANVDTSNIHIIGVSGGGYATLLAYMKTEHPVKTFSAWCSISDLYKWYYESLGRGDNYARDISNSTNNGEKFNTDHYLLGIEEAIKRSPYYMNTPIDKRENSKLFIYAGIHDGYLGSVPITQSLLFYNKIVKEFDVSEQKALIPEEDIIELVSSRYFIKEQKDSIGGRKIHYEKTYKDKIRLVIFEGGHEMLSDVALDHLNSERILTIGDSNGASDTSWVEQLKHICFDDFIYNTSVSGNTIGFNNNNKESLNTLLNIDRYLNDANDYLGGLDDIIIMLGTNDCKAVFSDSLNIVLRHLDNLLKKIKKHPVYMKFQPGIYVISPPPFGKDEIMEEKYHGGADRIEWLQPKFKNVILKNGAVFIDTYSKLLPNWTHYSQDGIHLNAEGQKIIADAISHSIERK
jgi:lysophospholipase L1-like esterase